MGASAHFVQSDAVDHTLDMRFQSELVLAYRLSEQLSSNNIKDHDFDRHQAEEMFQLIQYKMVYHPVIPE